MTHPVSVVIPTIDSRYDFLVGRCLPSVRAAGPAEIVVISGESRNGNEKRNAGVKATTQPYLLIVDDDSVLDPACISSMYEKLQREPSAAFAYSDYTIIVHSGVDFPTYDGRRFSGEFSRERLCAANFIHTTSLMRREVFCGFDPAIRRFQDWDLWLRVTANGAVGAYIDRQLFELHQIDRGVSASQPREECLLEVQRKHGLRP